jgi:hypothetical protein
MARGNNRGQLNLDHYHRYNYEEALFETPTNSRFLPGTIILSLVYMLGIMHPRDAIAAILLGAFAGCIKWERYSAMKSFLLVNLVFNLMVLCGCPLIITTALLLLYSLWDIITDK